MNIDLEETMKIGDLRRSQFMNYDCMWNGLVREVTAKLEYGEEEVSELDTVKQLLDFLKSSALLDADFPLEKGSRVQHLFMVANDVSAL